MRFNCQSCQAKYQIADEKVAGKSVRMKCRKCGAMIQVRAEQGEDGSVQAVAASGDRTSLAPSAAVQNRVSLPAPSPATAPRAPVPAPRPGLASSPQAASTPGRAPQPAGRAGLPRPGAPRAPLAPAARPLVSPAAPPAAPPRAQGDEEATSVMQRPSEVEMADAIKAFEAKRAAAPAAKPPSEPPAAATEADDPSEWYVGLEGEPVGPVPRAFVRAQLDAGKATAETLAWREGMTDWKPIQAIAELAIVLVPVAPPPASVSDPLALTRVLPEQPEALLMGEGPRSPSPAPEPRPPEPPAPPPPEPPPPEPAAKPVSEPPAPSRVPEPPATVPMGLGMADTIEPETERPVKRAAPPVRELESLVNDASVSGQVAAHTVADTPAARKEDEKPPRPAAPARESLPPDSQMLADLGIERRDRRRRGRGMSPVAYAFIAMAGGFGAVSAWLIVPELLKKDGGTSPVAVETAGASTALPNGNGAPSARAGGARTIELSPVDVGSATVAATGERPTSSGGASDAPTSASGKPEGDGKKPKECDPSDIFCGQEVAGPDSTGKSGSGDGSGVGLSQEQAQAVVARNKGAVAGGCRDLVTAGSVSVPVAVSVGPSGNVDSVSASDPPGYPGLASCLKSRIKRWKFPPSGGTTNVTVPFKFLNQ